MTFVGCANFSGSPQSSVSTRALFDEALEAAVDLGITAYDTVSVVLAQKTGSVLIPGDKRPEIRGKISGEHVEGQKARGNPEKLHPVVHTNSPNGKFGAIYSQHRSVPLHLDGILLLSDRFYAPQAFTSG